MERIKKTILCLVLATLAEGVIADSSVQIFPATDIYDTGNVTTPAQAVSYDTKSIVVDCPTGALPTAIISSTSDGSGSFVVDNFLAVDGVNVCPGAGDTKGCFTSFVGPPAGAALEHYGPISPLDVSASFSEGKHVVTFDAMDWGGIAAKSNIWLVTSCSVPPQVVICHKPDTPAQKTLTLPQSAVPGHLGHGDSLEECLP